jgi:hypothetical protein
MEVVEIFFPNVPNQFFLFLQLSGIIKQFRKMSSHIRGHYPAANNDIILDVLIKGLSFKKQAFVCKKTI